MALLAQTHKIVKGFASTGGTSTGETGDYVSLGLYNHITAIVNIGEGGDTGATVVLRKATSTTGASAADAKFHYFYDTNTSSGDALTDGGESTSAVTLSSGNNTLYVLEADAADLGDYDCATVKMTPSSGMAFDIVYVLSGARYADAAPPTAISS